MPELTKNVADVEDIEDACLQCKSRREGETLALNSALRKIAMLTAVCSVLCVLTISACGCSLYFYTRFQGFHQDLVALVRMEGEEADNILGDHFTMEHNAMPMYGDPIDNDDDFENESPSRLRHRRRKEKGKKKPRPKKCNKKKMKICDCCKKKLIEYIDAKIESGNKITTKQVAQALPSQASPTQQGGIAEQKQHTYVSAAHYTTYVDEKYIEDKFGKLEHDTYNNPPNKESKEVTESQESEEEMHLDLPEWQAAPLTLRFFKEADWMENSTAVKIFDFDNKTGKFIAKHTGLYHIYAHVLFYDVKTRMAIGLIHENKKGVPRDSKGKESLVFRCMESVDYVNPQLKIGQNAKFKSCSVNGVLFLNQGDTIAMQSLYKHTCLDLTYDATYFGAIYISTPVL
ncbi:uncharacterized protein LOC123553843 isoform X2 [Mercenaria mercenaria]|uniref:uncharacterized protein LOC123553843 isoform X2 n=1 Tax=Mercenaria mercenaria TaxID=6596 RepID=UPI00234E874E|nr:uncharacterized protein LOC123553843 isoform X2 [Mercenaria mercenaria]